MMKVKIIIAAMMMMAVVVVEKFWEETLFVADGSNNLLLCAIKCKTLHKKITGLGGKKMLLSSAIVMIIKFKTQEIERTDGLRPY